MDAAEFDSWLAKAVPAYAAEKIASGQWNKEDAQERSRKEHQELLPLGLASEGNHFFVILDLGAQTVGCLWFAVKTKFSLPIAYVFNVEVEPEYRRKGHARRAFKALEQEVALWACMEWRFTSLGTTLQLEGSMPGSAMSQQTSTCSRINSIRKE